MNKDPEFGINVSWSEVPKDLAGVEYRFPGGNILPIVPVEGQQLFEQGFRRVIAHRGRKREWPKGHWPICRKCKRRIKGEKIAIESAMDPVETRWYLRVLGAWHVRCVMAHAVLNATDGEPWPDGEQVFIGWVKVDLSKVKRIIPNVQAQGNQPTP